jgi:DNA uptake protein ComE-like DNA-binding protein
LECLPEQVRIDVDGLAHCSPDGQGERPTVEALLSLGGRVDLNRADEDTLARLPGISRSLARALTEERERRGPFLDWEEVESVRGVGPTRLRALQASTEIR